MSVADTVLRLLATVVVVALVGRACQRLLGDSDESHEELVPAWERRATTAVGVPLTLVGLSTMVEGPLAVPFDALAILLPGIVLLVYPDFSPSAV
ncbi:hypothetical protein ACFQMA_05955 [Halosimplex aquaticum]|uniref:Uncharacterized protein n=1 Tax=Halosimplex aquaticum TaxID=3026162 RepID=A0ABD5XXM1_9EURY|nr:hypothetical protein [Halosimplex aquaticum]